MHTCVYIYNSAVMSVCVHAYMCAHVYTHIAMGACMCIYICIFATPPKHLPFYSLLCMGPAILKIRNTFRKNQQLKNRELETPSPKINDSRTENDSGQQSYFSRRRVLYIGLDSCGENLSLTSNIRCLKSNSTSQHSFLERGLL